MIKKCLILFTLLFLVNFLFVRMSCGRRTCFDPMSVSLTAFDNADSMPHAPSHNGVLAKAFMLEYTVSGKSYDCNRNTIPFETIDSLQLTSNRDFDALHPAGTDLKDLFMMDYYTSHSYSPTPVPTKRYLMYNPSDTGTHIFTIKFFLHDTTLHSRYLVASTQLVKLLL